MAPTSPQLDQAATDARERDCRQGPGAGRRHDRPADQESAGAGADRPGPSLVAGDHRHPDRAHALRCVRLATGLHHLHADQRVLGRHGVDAPVRARRELTRPALHPRPVHQPGRAVVDRGEAAAHGRSAQHQPLRPAALGHHLLQRPARRLPESGRRSRRRRCAPGACRRRYRRASPARPWPSSRRSRVCTCCWPSRCS